MYGQATEIGPGTNEGNRRDRGRRNRGDPTRIRVSETRQQRMTRVVGPNPATGGRDWVVGDVHGCFQTLRQARRLRREDGLADHDMSEVRKTWKSETTTS